MLYGIGGERLAVCHETSYELSCPRKQRGKGRSPTIDQRRLDTSFPRPLQEDEFALVPQLMLLDDEFAQELPKPPVFQTESEQEF